MAIVDTAGYYSMATEQVTSTTAASTNCFRWRQNWYADTSNLSSNDDTAAVQFNFAYPNGLGGLGGVSQGVGSLGATWTSGVYYWVYQNASPLSPEEQAKQHAVWVAAQARQQQAEKRADRLLRAKLCGRELKALERLGFFDVRSRANPDVAYRIPESGMIVMFERGAPVQRLCVHPATPLPKGDRLLTLKLLAEAEPQELHRVANVHTLARRDEVAVGSSRLASRLERLPLLC